MTSSDLITQSRQGNPAAIAALMNHNLQSQGITAKVVLNASTIKILLEGEAIPDNNQLVPFVLKGIANLNLPAINTLQIYGRRMHSTTTAWTKTFSLPPDAQILEQATDSFVEPDLSASEDESANGSQPRTLTDRLEAIKLLLTETIDNDQITIQVEAEDKLLKVIAETDEFLQGPSFAEKIYKQLKEVDLSDFDTVGIYKRKLKGSNFFQIKSFTLDAL